MICDLRYVLSAVKSIRCEILMSKQRQKLDIVYIPRQNVFCFCQYKSHFDMFTTTHMNLVNDYKQLKILWIDSSNKAYSD